MRYILVGLLAGSCLAFGGNAEIDTSGKKAVTPAVEESPFDKGHLELEVEAGALQGLNTRGTPTRPDMGFALGQVRLGWMLYTPSGDSILRGNLEALLEGYGAGIYTGPGNEIFGAGILLRYNFVQPEAKIVPFMQLMFGGAWSDAAQDDSVQRLLGNNWSFSFGGEVGMRIMLQPRLSLTGGVEYRHLSNADIAPRNFGLNALGGTLGFSWFY